MGRPGPRNPRLAAWRFCERRAIIIRIDTDVLIPGRGEPVEDGTVIMEGSSISYAGRRSDAPSGTPDRTIRVPVLLPGLWDCHIHFGTQTPNELGSVVMHAPALLGSRAVNELGRTLDGGVTSVREVGGVGIELAGEIESGRIRSPHMHSDPLEDSSLWGDPDRVTNVWKSGVDAKSPA